MTALLALSAALTARADYQAAVLSQGPVGYWRLGETTQPPQIIAANEGSLGTTGNGALLDNVVRGRSGALSGSADTAYGFSNPGWVVTYLGSHVDVPYDPALNPNGSFTIELWAKPSSQATDLFSPLCSLDAGQNGGLSREGYLLYYDGATSKWNFRIGGWDGYAGTIEGGTATLGAWHHVVGVYNRSTIVLYVNGVPVNSAAVTPSAFTPNGTQPFRIGATTIPNRTFDGSVDEVAFYSAALSAGTIAAHYAAASTNGAKYAAQILTDSPVGYWRLGEAVDPVAVNLGSLGSAANGKYFYDALPGVPGPASPAYAGFDAANTAVAFDAAGGNISVPALNLNTNAVTITAWVRATGSQAASAGLVFCRSGATVAGLTMDPIAGGLGLGYNWDDNPATTSWSPSSWGLPALPDSDWAFVALIVQPSQAALFTCDSINYVNFTGVTNIPPTGHGKLTFAGSTTFGLDPGLATTAFNGALDEVAIFKRALSVGEVYSQYASAVGGIPPRIFADPQLPLDPLCTGDALRLGVDAGGTPSLAYQWRRNGGNLSGATASVYAKATLAAGDAGTYDCVVSNSFGSVASAPVVLAVGSPVFPAIVTPPVGRTLYPGGTLNLSVVASGGGLHYQWSRNSTPIAGATGSACTINSVAGANSGSYKVSVTNTAGSTNAGPATVTVRSPAAGYEAAIVADAPLAWWRLNEASGTNMWDSMGRFDGIYTNASGSPVVFGAPGAVVGSADTAVTFDGYSTSFGLVPFSPELNPPSFTLECWAKVADTVTTRVPVGSRSDGPRGYWFWTALNGAAWSEGIGVGGAQYYFPTTIPALSNVVAGVWMHLVFAYDPDADPSWPMRFYVNGQWDDYSAAPFDRNFAWPFTIGAFSGYGTLAAPSFVNLWNGQVDEVLFYDHAITLAQANRHYYLAVQGAPRLRAFLATPNTAVVGWPTNFVGYGLQQVSFLGATNWSNVTNTVTVVGSENQVAFPITAGKGFYRLFHP